MSCIGPRLSICASEGSSMFRARQLRSLLINSRRVSPTYEWRVRNIRCAATVNLQRVRFTQRVFSLRRLTTHVIYVSCALTYLYLILPILDEDEDEGEDEKGQEEEVGDGSRATDAEVAGEQESDEEDSLFIPLGWAKARPRTYYKGTDPEWQAFKKLSEDRERHQRMIGTLVGLLRTHIAHDVRLAPRFGQIDVSKGRFWLEVTYPPGPPLEYERNGIEITDEYIAWTKRPVSQRNYSRLQRALWPSAALSSFYASARHLVGLQLLRAKHLLGLAKDRNDAAGPTTPTSDQNGRHGEESGIPQTGEKSESLSLQPGGPTGGNALASSANKSSTSSASSGGKRIGLPQIPIVHTQNNDLPVTLAVFAKTLARSWNPLPTEPPRGSVVVSGLVEVVGTEARCIMDVTAAYDVEHERYVLVNSVGRTFRPRRQAPRGGN